MTESERYPASAIQRQFWLTNSRDPQSPAFNVPSVFRVRGRLDVDALEWSLRQLVARHEVLRTRFTSEGEELFQVVEPQLIVDLPTTEVPGEKDAVPLQLIDSLIQAEISRPFDLANGPLVRCRLFRLSETDWVLTIVLHHVISDLRTKDLIAEELSHLYGEQVCGVAGSAEVGKSHCNDAIDATRGQYRDYVNWHREFLSSTHGSKMCEYWREHLDAEHGLSAVPGTLRRPAVRSLDGTACRFFLSRDITTKLEEFSKANSINLFLTLLTAYFVLVLRYSGNETAIVGVPFTNRRSEMFKDVLGCFMNILPIKAEIEEATSVVELLRFIRKQMLLAHRNQEVPFETIVELAKLEHDPSHNPLFQVGFTFEHPMPLELNGLDVESLEYHSGGSQLDLFPVLWEKDGEVRGYFEFNSDVYKEEDIRAFVANYRATLTAILDEPSCSVVTLPILDPAVKRRIEVEWNDTSRDYPVDSTLKTLFEDQVARTPNRTAVVFGENRLTYAELNSSANRVAHTLLARGVPSGGAVGIFLNRSLEMVVGIYGAVKAGCAYVPLDTDNPSARTRCMVNDAGISLVLTSSDLADLLAESTVETLCIDTECASVGSTPEHNLDGVISETDAAYIIFTSGSTGRPKGVINSHRGICNRLRWMQEEFQLGEADTVLQKTPISFDVSVWELFWPLAVGARLAIAPPDSHRDPSRLASQIDDYGVTTIHFVPSMLQAFLDNADLSRCGSLKRVVCSGEPLPSQLVGKYYARMQAELYNLYGPTEAAVDVSCFKCKKEDAPGIVPIGKPIANTRLYILDEYGQTVPLGVPGELFIGGVQVALGYANDPEKTEDSFLPDPFEPHSTARLYRTGDIARYLHDGNVEFLGRTDSQVKIRGFRVELGEIENALNSHPGIASAAARLDGDGGIGSSIIAYAVPDVDNAYTVSRLLNMGWEKPSGRELARLENGLEVARLPNGQMICQLNKSETEFVYEEVFVQKSYSRQGIVIEDGAVVLDVGANIGIFSVFAATAANDVTVYAFEPIPPVYSALESNVALHRLNIIPIECGLSDRVGTESFTYYPHVSILSGRHADVDTDKQAVLSYLRGEISVQSTGPFPNEEALDELLSERLTSEQHECRLTTLSEVLRERNLDRVNLLKIDVERSELEVLQGIEQGDWEKIGQICLEVHDSDGRVDEIVQLLEENSFGVEVEHEGESGLSNVYARREGYAHGEVPRQPPMAENGIQWEDPALLVADLRRSLAETLPEYMIPAEIVLVADLPLTQSGKIDRKALPVPLTRRTQGVVERLEPKSGTEELLAALWKELLNTNDVGLDDNFFSIGGNSLLAVYMVGEIQKRLNRHLSVVKLFEFPTVRLLAGYLTEGESSNSYLEDANLRARKRRGRRSA